MSNMPLDTTVIEARLKDQVTELVSVGGAADFAAIKELASLRCPAAYVVPTKEKGNNDRATHTCQVMAGFGVVIAVRHYGDATGAKARNEARSLIGAVRDALVGWMPADRAFRECFWLEGDVLEYDDSVLLWADAFQTSFFMTGAH
ncbi:phage tail terminator protein [Gilvimarinus agarilyticus]|uniref:phage tail terminator protein n=1 Tax=Gilvimarinus agarilyticus TaxID=679259 RepID=UPI0005A05818|nr:hypothetical protein [Gilvimarinus agarilyticus]